MAKLSLILPFVFIFTGTLFNLGFGLHDHHKNSSGHSVQQLIRRADAKWQSLLANDANSLNGAANHYRHRRGRDPPPGFKERFKFTRSKNAKTIEEFLDRIYDNLDLFSGLRPGEIGRQNQSLKPRITVRNDKANTVTDKDTLWLNSWLRLLQSIEQYLPGLGMPFCLVHRSWLVVLSETIGENIIKQPTARLETRDKSPPEFITQYTAVTDENKSGLFEPPFLASYDGWVTGRVGWPTNNPSHRSQHINPNSVLPAEMSSFLQYSQNEYVYNWNHSEKICWRFKMQAVHGAFIEPVSISTTHELLSLFGRSKLLVITEILIPLAPHAAKDMRYAGSNRCGSEWESKKKKYSLIGRGVASAAQHTLISQTGLHRHRPVAMLNTTCATAAEWDNSHFLNFILSSYDHCNLTPGRDSLLPEFVEEHVGIWFTYIVCYPSGPRKPCDDRLKDLNYSYTQPHFSLVSDQQYDSIYLPDVDENFVRERYRGVLLSTSLPIKSNHL
jgi:hypothetical protein